MQKNINKTESVAEFMARGGAVTKLPSKGPKKNYKKAMLSANLADVNMSVLPEALKIKYGIK